MKTKKLLFALIVGLMMVFALAACGGGEESSGESDGSSDSGSSEGSSEEQSESSGDYAQGVTDDEILVGHIGPQTGSSAIYDLMRKGIDSYFKYVNENGGVNGRQLKLIAYDDEYQPAKAVQAAKRLVEEDKVFAILGEVCTPCSTAAQDYIVEQGIPMVLMNTGAKHFVNPPIKNYMGSGLMNYRIEARVYLDYAVNELGAKKIGLAYNNDDYGKEGYEAIKNHIEEYPGVEIVQEVNWLSTDTDMSAQTQKLQEANPDTILAFTTPGPAASFKKAMHKIDFTEPNLIVSSVAGNDKNLFELAGEDVWEGTYSGSSIPQPEDAADDEDMQLYLERFGADYPDDPTGGFGREGWAEAQVFVEALKRTGDDLTWDSFLESFYSFDNWDGSLYAGISFSENNHYGLTSMFMTQAKDGKITPITDTITFEAETEEIHYSE